ncbi:MAG: HAD family hydrolase [Thermoplasmata archaeon]
MPSRRYEVLFFDVGGTLAWAEPKADVIWVRALEEHGHTVTAEEIVAKSGVGGPEFNRPDIIRAFNETDDEFRGSFPTPEGQEAFFRRYDEALLRRLGLSPDEAILQTVRRLFQGVVSHLFDDVRSTLTGLEAEGYRLGVISNATHNLPEGLEKLDLTRHFESITYSYAVGAEKPDPRIFRSALSAMEVSPSAAVHIGDHVKADVQGALRVGITPMLIDRKGKHPEGDFIVLRSLNEISERLTAGGSRKGS